MACVRMTILLAVILGMVLVMKATSVFGPGISPDSANYLSTAENVMAGRGFVTFHGESFVLWPPLYPAILAFLGKMGFTLLSAARLLNAAALGIIILLSGSLLSKILKTKALVLFGAIVTVLSMPLLRVSVMAWSEPVFIVLLLLFVIFLSKYIVGRKTSALFLAAAIAALACLQRYAGVTVVLTGIATLLLMRRNISFKDLCRDEILFISISLSPFTAWLLHNYWVTGTLMGERIASQTAFVQNIISTSATISIWVCPSQLPLIIREIFPAMVLLPGLFAIVSERENKTAAPFRVPVMVSLIFVGIYLSFIIVSASRVHYDPLEDRLLSPIFPPLVFIVLYGLEKFMGNLYSRWNGRRANMVLLGVMSVWLLYPFGKIYRAMHFYITSETGVYNTAEWRRSPIISWIKDNVPDGKIVSNSPDALYALAGISAAKVPSKSPAGTATPKENTYEYVVWFNKFKRPYLIDYKDLPKYYRLKEVRAFPEGKVFSIEQPV